jgi:DNA-binding CsgD family transcriptional regulator
MTDVSSSAAEGSHALHTAELKRGRAFYGARSWGNAYRSLSLADTIEPLCANDLEYLAVPAYLTGHDDEYLEVLQRAHRAHIAEGDIPRAVRCACWLTLRLLFRGEIGRATGWLARAQRLLDRDLRDSVEEGYLLLPTLQQLIIARNWEAVYELATRAAEIGERFNDTDLINAARHLQARSLLQRGRVTEALTLLDGVMANVVIGDLSPLVTGYVFSQAIQSCIYVYALERAREWSEAFARWCDSQPEMLAFTGTCSVLRAQVMQVSGAWLDAIEEAQRAFERCSLIGQCSTPTEWYRRAEVHARGTGSGVARLRAASAAYQQGEVHRLRGEFEAAEKAFRVASEHGMSPYPGLALLRAAQGRIEAASAAIRRVLAATTDQFERTRFLPAYIDIMLAAGETSQARAACADLGRIAKIIDTDVLSTIAMQAHGFIELAEGNAQAAIGLLRSACRAWQQFGAPYAAARVRVQVALACRALADDDGCELELSAARAVFEELGAAPDLAYVDSLGADPNSNFRSHGLTLREMQVLRRVAAGVTNRKIASEFSLSEKTVDRHVSNIFAKLDVPSRTAATAYAYEHKLL